MPSRLHTQLIALVLAVSLVVPAAFFTKPPEADAAASCLMAYLASLLKHGTPAATAGTTAATAAATALTTAGTAEGTAVVAVPETALGYPVGWLAGGTILGAVATIGLSNAAIQSSQLAVQTAALSPAVESAGSNQSMSFASCVLKPIAIQMARTMVRNISNSIINWINNDFKGKPSFITDINGTLADSADETIGNFIYGSDLQFLCQPFAFQIRAVLATKYFQPFPDQVRCTLSGVAKNVKGFVNNNGGAGWNNWLELTTQPQNNVYGAYLMADSQLASKVQGGLDKLNNMLNRNGGFLDFQVCDKWTDPAKASGIVSAGAATAGSNQLVTGGSAFNVQTTLGGTSTQGTGAGLSGPNLSFGNTNLNVPTQQSNTLPTFTTSSGQTVGLDKTCDSWKTTTPGGLVESQATKVLGGWADQLNLAQDIDQIIGALISHFADKMIAGTQGILGMSKSGGYAQQTLDYAKISSITSDTSNPDNAGLDLVNAAAGAGLQQIVPNPTTVSAGANIAVGKPVAMSFPGVGSSAWITDGDVSTSASTASTTDPWMQIDMGASTAIDEVHVWSPAGASAADALGTFDVVVSNVSGARDWVSGAVSATATSSNPIVIPVGQTGQFIRVERLNDSAGTPLTIAEIEVIAPASQSGTTATSTASTAGGAGTATPQISFGAADGPASVQSGAPFLFTVPINASSATTIPTLDVRLTKSGSPVGFSTAFTNGAVGKKQSGIVVNYYPGAAPGITFANVPVGGSSNTAITVSGSALTPSTAYNIAVTARDSTGTTLGSASIDFVVQ